MQESHVVQITSDFQSIANHERAISRAAYEVQTSHGWEITQANPTDFKVKITFSDQADAEKMIQKIKEIDPNLKTGTHSLKRNPSKLAA